MEKDEIYTAIVLITVILISVLWRAELKYRRNFSRINYPVELKMEPPADSINIIPYNNGYLGKRKPNPKNWLKKHGKYLHLNSLASVDI